ncbi:major capsid protein [Agrobacterium sp. O3.4]|jgi:hypothetical protein|nr:MULTISPECIES: major capsid protein [Rhizobium]MBO9198612.1 hypothetical protein [Rhizobium sp. 16-449-1b]MCZ7472729.1 major capsid protein [Rhizobium rhizogenes]
MNMKKLLAASALVAFSAGAVFAQEATGPDFSTLTSSIDYSTVITAIMQVAAGIITVLLAISGAKFVLGMIRRA